MFNNQIIAGAAGQGGGGFYSYSIGESLRFEESGTANLTFTPSSNGTDNKKFTYSVWIKRGQQSADDQHLIQSKNTGSGTGQGAVGFFLDTSDSLDVYTQNGGANPTGTRLLRDHSGWYHCCFVYDTTEATAADRVKVYINGDRDTLSGSFPPLNSVMSSMNYNGQEQYIGKYVAGYTRYFNGYMAEIHMVDGQALSPTDFAEEVNGIWVPKQYTDNGTTSHGVNGYHLDFADSANIGNDVSGNNNDWTANNLAASDVVLDSPTNNFATFNPLDLSGSIPSFFEGNLKVERSGNFAQAYSSFSFDSGKWYAEYLIDTGNAGPGVIAGTTNPAANRYLGQDTYTYGYYRDGRKINSGSYTSYGGSYTVAADGSGDVVGVYIDADNGNIYFSVNGTVQNSGTAAFTGVTGPFRFAADTENGGFVAVNFGQDDTFAGLKTSGSAAASDDNGNGVFYDTIGLSGYLAPCSANLPEPTIGPNSGVGEQADDYFNTVLYTGNGSTQSITGVGFQPDWVWLKSRSNAQGHNVFDSVRGVNKALFPNDTNAEFTDTDRLTSFDSDGFSLGADANVNTNSATYVSWNWKAGGTAVSNTDGSITSQVSAAPDAGFSVGTVTTRSQADTIGHSLSQAPEMVIFKPRTGSLSWGVLHTSLSSAGAYLFLESSGTGGSASAYFNSTAPTSSVFSIGSTWGSRDAVFYAFHSVPGYQAVGSYVGNGSTDGTFVYTGFRPAWIMTKRSDGTSWGGISDSARSTYNQVANTLAANENYSESTLTSDLKVDFLSNGFKIRDTDGYYNASGGSYIYLAFAEAPFKYANAR